ncbi:cytochrome P450 [Mycobacterium manitobense]|uniref:Steroid C26-monooxygenase n=1 Tax=[Mycobacterium] manitobense TaxID=190147 RepID=A0A9X2YKP9_9MYCO|nr:cytochrome P450 [[Mycobacterium] manitobense]MCV7169225.1 cytochrome P450 [[Mycobacterium] manitobense]
MTDSAERPLILRRHNVFEPDPELTRARDEGVLTRVPLAYSSTPTLAYVVTNYEHARSVLANSADFAVVSADYGPVSDEEAAVMRAGNLLEMNPPEHSRLRRMLVSAFTARRIAALESRITEIVEGFLDDLAAQPQPADLVAHFALPVPSLVICELLGVPYHDRDEFQQRAQAMVDSTLSSTEQLQVDREQRRYMAGLVAMAQADPGDDLLGALVRSHGADLSADELVGIGSLLLIAGHETTANMLGLGTLALLRHPDQLAALRDDQELIGPAVEELMRWLSIVPTGVERITTRDVTIGDHTIPSGEHVVVYLPAANRDPGFVTDPDRLDVRRGAPGHVAFGHGVHHCLGAPLARAEMRVAFPALLRRFPNLALGVPFEDIAYRRSHAVYGVHALPVTW